ncbi:DNA replication and repair protein RecF [Alcanivorax hongdengensis A-11-3]|uniref:DNA replication and repair protein RecF n=1 Tax=Alcanivorax hongdengensis A-11-3 TaxID=1177179 RepID=L0W9I9_9GAMM|nr:DNA replication/repair protein RecF [Alcanivorax hongdengensis]EKF73669.1 DNA replication and repair protein RecF [Alcanivorax hongdengensis A-11-3]
MLSRLQLGNFRNYSQAEVAFCPRVNVILGDNGSGKTSLLEAVYFIGSGGRSFRGGRLSRLVKDQADAATLYAEVAGADDRVHRLGVRRTPGGIDALKLDGQTPRALSEVATLLPVLALHPGSVELVFGASALRRRFLDWGMFHVEHDFMPLWRQAAGALKHRNALLKKGRPTLRELAFWDQQLAQSSDRIEGLRRRYLAGLQSQLDTALAALSPELSVVLTLQTGLHKGENYLQALERVRADDIRRGFSQVGFHRADLRLETDGVLARDRVSRGQAKLVAYALVLAQLPMIQAAGKVCTLLVDDLGAELDARHRHQVLHYLASTGHQTLITALDLPHWQGLAAENNELSGVESRMFHVEHGRIRRLTDC